jgi:flagella basal body P-ring formation protein FlgA
MKKILFILSLWVFHCEASVTKLIMAEIKKAYPPIAKVEIESVFYPEGVPDTAKLRNFSQSSQGYVQFELFWNEKSEFKKAFGNAAIRVFIPVAVAKTALTSGQIFSAENVFFKEMEITQLGTGNYFNEMKSLNNLQVLGYIRAGSVISSHQTQEPYVVQRGQKVDLVHEKNNMRISVQVQALENGRKNDWIRVENPSSHKIITAKVNTNDEVLLK